MNNLIDKVLSSFEDLDGVEFRCSKDEESIITNYIYHHLRKKELNSLIAEIQSKRITWVLGLLNFIKTESYLKNKTYLFKQVMNIMNASTKSSRGIKDLYELGITYLQIQEIFKCESKKFAQEREDFLNIILKKFNHICSPKPSSEDVYYSKKKTTIFSGFFLIPIELISQINHLFRKIPYKQSLYDLCYLSYYRVNPLFETKSKKINNTFKEDNNINIFLNQENNQLQSIMTNTWFNSGYSNYFDFYEKHILNNNYISDIAKKQRFYGGIIVNSSIINPTVSSIQLSSFQNFNLVELYNLSDIELDFDREDLKDYFFYKPMVIHKSLNEKSVITKDKNKFVYAYVDNKGYLIGYEGDSKEVVLPSYFVYGNKLINEYEIREHAVNNQSYIERLTIPNNVTKLGNFIFFNQPNLKKLILDCHKVEVIPSFAFACCTKLESIYIPKSIKLIEGFAFSACKSLKDIYYEGTKEEWNKIEIIKSKSKYNDDELGKAKVHFNYNIDDEEQ